MGTYYVSTVVTIDSNEVPLRSMTNTP